MVTVTLATQRIREVHFVNHIDKSGQIQLSSSFNFHVDYAADNTRCVAKLYQSAQMKDDPDKLFISAEIVGIFNLQGVTDEDTKREAHVQCYDQLFPYLPEHRVPAHHRLRNARLPAEEEPHEAGKTSPSPRRRRTRPP